MFTGIVETTATLLKMTHQNDILRLVFQPKRVLSDYTLGESIAVNGVCLTVVEFDQETFSVEVVPETLRHTSLSQLKPGLAVNIERALLPSTRLGGHFVQGHVDTTSTLSGKKNEGDAQWLTFTLPTVIQPYVVKKGFITIDGMSLTVADLTAETFMVTLIPHTLAVTIGSDYTVGQCVNIEVDILAKYVESLLGKK